MKYFSKLSYFGILLMIAAGFGCSDYLNVNTDPNNPTKAPLTGLMTSTTYNSSIASYSLGDHVSFFVQYLASPNPASDTDIMDPVHYDGTWADFYNVMTDLAVMRKKAKKIGATEYQGAAEIMLAMNLATVVDVWGNVPYGQAFFLQTLTPKYNEDAALYDSVMTLLDDGIADLQKSESSQEIGDDDFMYQGDTGKWTRLGYMLKARYLNHLSKLSDYSPKDILNAVDKGFQSNDDDAQVGSTAFSESDVNPWYSIAQANAGLILGGWLSEQIVNQMNGTTYGVFDPRIKAYTDTTDDGTYKGTRNGAGRGGDTPPSGARNVLPEDGFYSSEDSPIVLASYAEQKFIEAEAAFREGNKIRAYKAYVAGIQANMDKLGVSSSEEQQYLNDSKVAVGASNLTLNLIFKEKYAALFLQPESWVDARRHDYQYKDMKVPENLNSNLNGHFARRLVYPNSEINRNEKNVPNVTMSDRIFWDKK